LRTLLKLTGYSLGGLCFTLSYCGYEYKFLEVNDKSEPFAYRNDS